MLRKIGIAFIAIIFAFCALLFWQKDKIEKKLTALLAESHLKVGEVELDFFPMRIKLNEVNYLWHEQQSILSAKHLYFNLSGTDLLSAKLNINKLEVNQGTIQKLNQSTKEFEKLDISLFPRHSAISIFDLMSFNLNEFIQTHPNFSTEISGLYNADTKFQLKTEFSLALNTVLFSHFSGQVNLSQPLINTKQINVDFEQGKLIISNSHQYNFMADGFQFNQIPLGKLKGSTNLNQTNISFDNKINIQVAHQAEQQHIQLRAQAIALAKWLTAFNVSDFIDGNTSLKAGLISNKGKLESADVEVEVTQGKLKNLNLLDLVSQYLPVNYDESSLANQMDTKFEQFNSRFSWRDKYVDVEKIGIKHRYFLLNGKGRVDIANNQCDFRTDVQPQINTLLNMSLPIKLSGNCNSLEYSLEINRSFRNQLKDLIKQKWK